jgi:cysteine desulfurase
MAAEPKASIYLDHAATTPIDGRVLELMRRIYTENFANPSSAYRLGQASRCIVEEARRRISKVLNCASGEIVFTGGGTEADNLAILGIVQAQANRGRHIITSQIEHPAVLKTCGYLQRRGFEITYLPVGSDGLIDPDDLRKSLRTDTVLVSLMHANNEIGTIQPIEEIARLLAETEIYFHTDAVQTVGHLPLDLEKFRVDLLSFSAHKFYGPKGVGGLYVRHGTRLDPLVHGGGQEHGLRSGTENVAGIAGMGLALAIANERWKREFEQLSAWRDRLLQEIPKAVERTQITGHLTQRLPGTASFCFEQVNGESLVLKLDLEGFSASTGSACHAGEMDPSPVLLALGLPRELANGSLRLTLGRLNSETDIDRLLQVLPRIIQSLRG